jgi:hypothetical protein
MSPYLSFRYSPSSIASTKDEIARACVIAILLAARRNIYKAIFEYPRPPITRVLEGTLKLRMTKQGCPRFFVIGEGKIPPCIFPSHANAMVTRGYLYWNLCGMTSWATMTRLQESLRPLGAKIECIEVMPKAKMILLRPDCTSLGTWPCS